jgi:hypothetical protein
VRLSIANDRVDPVPGSRRVDGVERLDAVPLLERGDMDVRREAGEIPARLLGKLRSQLERDDREAALEQWPRRLPGSATDLEQAIARLDLRELDEVVEQRRGVRGPRRVVAIRNGVERRA